MMLARNPDNHFLFALADLQRAVRAYADQKARATASPARNGRCW